MAKRLSRPPGDILPVELEAALVRDAERDADGVVALLDALGFRRPGDGEPPVRLPAQFLLGLGLAVRLFSWESKGLRVHLDAGVAPAKDVLRDVVRRTAQLGPCETDADVASLRMKVLCLSVQRFAWAGPAVLGADVVVGDPDEELLLDALARLCWASRRKESANATHE
jgi:hypothetical protein